VRAWRQNEGEEASMSLQEALDLPRIKSRHRRRMICKQLVASA
jgi:hypothetical protein